MSTGFLVPEDELPVATCTVNWVQGATWRDNFQVSIKITNTGTTPVNGWVLRWEFANGQSVNVRVREAKSVRAIASGPTGCQLDTVGLTQSPFDPDVFVVKVDAGNALSEGGAVRANNEARF